MEPFSQILFLVHIMALRVLGKLWSSVSRGFTCRAWEVGPCGARDLPLALPEYHTPPDAAAHRLIARGPNPQWGIFGLRLGGLLECSFDGCKNVYIYSSP